MRCQNRSENLKILETFATLETTVHPLPPTKRIPCCNSVQASSTSTCPIWPASLWSWPPFRSPLPPVCCPNRHGSCASSRRRHSSLSSRPDGGAHPPVQQEVASTPSRPTAAVRRPARFCDRFSPAQWMSSSQSAWKPTTVSSRCRRQSNDCCSSGAPKRMRRHRTIAACWHCCAAAGTARWASGRSSGR